MQSSSGQIELRVSGAEDVDVHSLSPLGFLSLPLLPLVSVFNSLPEGNKTVVE